MALHPVLGLVLCLGWTVNTQEGNLPTPFISAEPDPVIPQGSSVTIVCSNPGGYDTFRLEKKNGMFQDKENTKPSVTEARFLHSPVNETTAGHYWCIYQKMSKWSQRSGILELKVTNENVTGASSPSPGATSETPQLKTYSIYIAIVVSVVVLLCLLFLLLVCLHSHRQKKQRLPNSKSQQQRPQESLATIGLESTPDIVTGDRLPEDTRTESKTSVAGGLQEVTYVQLNHHALTQSAVGAVTPQSTVTMAGSSTYAAIIRR